MGGNLGSHINPSNATTPASHSTPHCFLAHLAPWGDDELSANFVADNHRVQRTDLTIGNSQCLITQRDLDCVDAIIALEWSYGNRRSEHEDEAISVQPFVGCSDGSNPNVAPHLRSTSECRTALQCLGDTLHQRRAGYWIDYPQPTVDVCASPCDRL
jgi:hypothetical protein